MPSRNLLSMRFFTMFCASVGDAPHICSNELQMALNSDSFLACRKLTIDSRSPLMMSVCAGVAWVSAVRVLRAPATAESDCLKATVLLMICTTCFCEHLMLLNVQSAWNDFRLRVRLFLSLECFMSLITRSQLASVLLPISTSMMTSMPSCSITAPLCCSCGSISRSVRTVASCAEVSLTLRACILAMRRSARSFAARRPMLLLRLPLRAVEGAAVGDATVDARVDAIVVPRLAARVVVVVEVAPAMGRVVVVGFAS